MYNVVGYQRHATDLQPRPPWEVGAAPRRKWTPREHRRFMLWAIASGAVLLLFQAHLKKRGEKPLNPWMGAGMAVLVGWLAANYGWDLGLSGA